MKTQITRILAIGFCLIAFYATMDAQNTLKNGKDMEYYKQALKNGVPGAKAYIGNCWVDKHFAANNRDEAMICLDSAYSYLHDQTEYVANTNDVALYIATGIAFVYHYMQSKDVNDLNTYLEMIYNSKDYDYMPNICRYMYKENIEGFESRFFEPKGKYISIYQVFMETAKNAGIYSHVEAEAYYLYASYADEKERYNVNRDAKLKAKWGMTRVEALKKAAQMGNKDAQKLLGDWYQTGHNVPKNLTNAKLWHKKAEQNNDD